MIPKIGMKQQTDFFVALALAVGKLCFSLAVNWVMTTAYHGCSTPEKQEKMFLRLLKESKRDIIVLRQPADPSDDAPPDKKLKGRITRSGWVAVK